MVSLSTAYGLCSLIDQEGFVHVSEDDSECAIVTLGKNIAIRYRLRDQKQLNSWSTISQFTSSVVFSPSTSHYYAIFNENILKKWSENDQSVDKVHKIRLKDTAHKVILAEEPVVLFTSGACCTVACVENKNHESISGFLPKSSKILLADITEQADEKYLVLIAHSDMKSIYSVKLGPSEMKPVLSTLKTQKLRRRGQKLLGYCYSKSNGGLSLVTLWSDGFLYTLPLPLVPQTTDLLGRFVGVIRVVSCTSSVGMAGLSDDHIAIYGGDPLEDGAIVVVYNLKLGMVQASTSFKLLQKPPRIWAVHSRLLLGLGHRLICVPYSLETSNVSALVGTRCSVLAEASTNDVMAVVPTVDWGKKNEEEPMGQEQETKVPKDLTDEFEFYTSQGCPESGICEKIIRELIEKRDIDKLSWCLENFLDVPEHLIVRLISFTLTTPDTTFKKDAVKPLVNGINGKSSPESPILTIDTEENKSPITPKGRATFLNKVLKIGNNKSKVVPILRSGLSFTQCISLIQYLTHLLSLGFAEMEKSAEEWAMIAVDAFYQQLVIGKNQQCIDVILSLKAEVEEKILCASEADRVLPLLLKIKNRKKLDKTFDSSVYCIRKLQLYPQ